jgi:preprotein translocase subunit Sss1
MAVHGSLWLLIVGIIGFVVLVGKIGCLSHD